MEKLSRVKFLFEAVFGAEGAAEQAEYVCSMSNNDDIKDWLLDVYDDSQLVDTFMQHLHSPVSVPAASVAAPSVTAAPASVKPFPFTINDNRTQCTCQARTHHLIGNCLNCGRIVCAKEEYGDCLFCKEPHTGRMHWNGTDEGNGAAVAMKTRLIQYDREGARRTKIYDDSTDWFAESKDVWISAAERAEAARLGNEYELRKLQAKKELVISLDFSTQKVILVDKNESIANVEKSNKEAIQEWIIEKPKPHIPNPYSLFSFIDDEANEVLDRI